MLFYASGIRRVLSGHVDSLYVLFAVGCSGIAGGALVLALSVAVELGLLPPKIRFLSHPRVLPSQASASMVIAYARSHSERSLMTVEDSMAACCLLVVFDSEELLVIAAASFSLSSLIR